jgi:dTDP-4-dehydrorhamnose reductase
MKILLFGKNGQVGWELQRSLAILGSVIALDVDSSDYCGDFSDLPGLAATVRAIRPDVVVNAAAHTAVDKAESEPDLARTINALAPQAIAQAAHELGALMVHYSTDYVFDGSGVLPWVESDPTAPLNVYGRTKLEGEQLLAAACVKHLIFRTSWVYAARGGNFAKTMLRLAKEKTSLSVIDDQVGAPTGADLLADVTASALRQALHAPGLAGTYHVVAAGETSWHGYASFVVQQALAHGVALTVTPDQVLPVASTAFVTAAQRPHNSRLNTQRVTAAFDLHLPAWQAGVARMLTEIF